MGRPFIELTAMTWHNSTIGFCLRKYDFPQEIRFSSKNMRIWISWPDKCATLKTPDKNVIEIAYILFSYLLSNLYVSVVERSYRCEVSWPITEFQYQMLNYILKYINSSPLLRFLLRNLWLLIHFTPSLLLG